jgi:hypothetical protein
MGRAAQKPAANAKARPTGDRRAELLRLEKQHFTKAGRERRISRARTALKGFRVEFDLDAETVKWIAQGADLEDL